VVRDVRQLRSKIGMIYGGERGLYYRLSGRDNLQYFADLYKAAKAKGMKAANLKDLFGDWKPK
jgi:ABC-2 type transport system ATP-binding protein